MNLRNQNSPEFKSVINFTELNQAYKSNSIYNFILYNIFST